MKIGIVANQVKKEAVFLAEKIISYIKTKNIDFVYCKNIYEDNKESALLNNADFIIVLGGDGTILSLVRSLENKKLPILGINFGRLGFIAESEPELYRDTVDRIIAGDFYISERKLLKASLYKKNSLTPLEFYSLNEFVVGKNDNVRLLSVDTYINDYFLVNYKADGLIIASSTGSTAYNLSAGGPVMHPSVEAYIITPICPHTLNERPLIVPKTEELKIRLSKHQKALFTVDGQCNEIIDKDDYVAVSGSTATINLIEFSKFGFYDKLKSRLFWGK